LVKEERTLKRLLWAFLLLIATTPAMATCLKSGEEPLRPLYRFSAEPLGEVIDPTVARVFGWFWRWHDAPLKARRDSLNLSGSVLVDGKPQDFTLDVRQHGEAQVYFLEVHSFGKVVLTVNPPLDGRQELQFDLQREGEDRVRSGSLRLEAQ
jgi:hypothetical protein